MFRDVGRPVPSRCDREEVPMRTPLRLLRISAAALLLTAATATTVTLTTATTSPAEAAIPIDPTRFQQVTLARGEPEVGEPMSLAVLPDRSVLHTARNGTLRRTDAAGVRPDHRRGQLRLAALHRHQHQHRDVQRVDLPVRP